MAKTTLTERVAKLEERVDNGLKYISKEIKEMKDNHLHTLQTDMDALQMKVNALTVKVAVIVAVASFIASAIIEVISRFIFR